ncbi:multi drug resistance-associated protein MRP [Aspergillus parasiticus SU-1]|uniref:Multi drug resistance-associated protein MRP n=1 Tax=Aspergillus parasiticus (strain ATCC 56775 / NRRL 5862 / SRRC 143 / SU-1) TaxID=1403190 RepID=A0A0F0I8R4_ASPPU|nr:multi drug resistance-associated protein MRP [Aspergillus parasiticus SU-1]
MSDFLEGFQQIIGPSLSQLGGEEGAYDSDSGLLLRRLWQYRTQKISAFVATGNLHLAVVLLSCVVLLLAIGLHYAARSGRSKSRVSAESLNEDLPIRVSLPFAFLHLAAAIAACCLGWIDAQHANWKQPIAVSYAVLLGLMQFCFKNERARAHLYRHINAVTLAIFLLACAQDLLPLLIIGATSGLSVIRGGLIACLAAVVIVAAATPRPRRLLVSDTEAEETKTVEELSPEETCSLFSYYCSYEWLTYVILRGCRRDLTMDDLPPLPSYDEPSKWLTKIKTQRLKGGKTFRTLCRLLKTEIKSMMCWSSITAVLDFVAPYSMLRLLAYLENPEDAILHPALWVALLFIGPMSRSLCYQQYIFTATRLLVRVNVSLVQEIYQTAMRSYLYDDSIVETSTEDRPKSSRKMRESAKGAPKSSQANITSLMSYDVDAIYNSRDIFFVATAAPIATTVAVIFLYRMLGWPSLFGVSALLCLSPLPALASRRVSRIQRSVMRATDVRLSKISEYLNSIRTLKYFGWEHAAMESINEARGVEQRRLWKRSVYAAAISMAGDLLPMMSLLVMFSVFVLFTNDTLRAATAFTSLSIMETLRSQFVWLSNISKASAQGAESLRRVDRFFDTAREIKHHPEGPLELKNATFRRTPIAAFRLHDVSVRFRPRALNVVTGPTGSGKTSLLLSLLGETVLESGTASCPRDVAYVPQAPWLQNDTIRDNITFFSPFDKARYNTVIEASGLAQDLRQLPAGDLTVVGEKGTSLSGGQKQRVSLARALYSQSSTLLLDDIFSALDTHTTTLVYDKCFRSGLLSDRTVVLITHYPAALQDAELLVRLDHGKASTVETPSSLPQALLQRNPLIVEESLDVPSEPTTTIAPAHEQQSPQVSRIAKETSATGRVPRTLALQYMLLFGGPCYAPLAMVVTIAVQFAYFAITYWLSIWMGAYEKYENPNSLYYLGVYAAAIILFLLLQLSGNLLYQYGSWTAAKKMHRRLVTAVLSAPISWFDQNPTGRLINRFGNDTRSLDTVLIDWLRMSIENGLRFLLRIASVASIMPIFALPAAVICTVGFILGEMYTRTQISIKRLTSINYSPVFSHFTDSLSGLCVIRARKDMDVVFQRLLAEKLAVHARSAETQYNCNRWISVRSDLCAASVAAAAGCVAYFWSGPAGLVGFSLTNAIGLSQNILNLVRTMNELEVELNCFQRVREYADIEPEEHLSEDQAKSSVVPASWPTSGRVEFHNVTARYQEDGPDVLRSVSFVANPGERIGLVGRTGSGKSTLGLSLLRFVNIASGQITIDGVDISQIFLNRLRTSVTLIPQEPVLFSGDVHSNLDPFGESSETELASALAACTSIHVPDGSDRADHAHPAKTARPLALDTPVAANGENFSQGQRQVLSLARAMCRRSKVVLLDEATASVDHETDKHMQRVLREMFPDCTIIAIAHRLRTIMDYDRVLVMADGEIVENDTPANLVKKEGIFWDMLRNAGEYDELIQMIETKPSTS